VISAAFMAFWGKGLIQFGWPWTRCTHWQILLVGENQENGIPQLVLVQHALQFLPSLNNTVAIVAVNNEDDALGVLEVMSPQGSNLVLSTNIPYGELNVLVFHGLNVEAWEGRISVKS
jgi:hypothetical protein